MSRDLEQPILVKNLLKSLESLIPGSIRPSRPTSSTDLPDHLQRHDLSRSSALFNLRCLYRANGSLQCALIDAAPPVCRLHRAAPPVCRLPLVLACRRRVCVGVSAAAARVCWFARRVGWEVGRSGGREVGRSGGREVGSAISRYPYYSLIKKKYIRNTTITTQGQFFYVT